MSSPGMCARSLRAAAALLLMRISAAMPSIPELLTSRQLESGNTISSYSLPDIGAHLHVYSESHGWYNSYSIIEGPNEVILYDVPRLVSDGREFKGFVESLGKHLTRVIVSQPHPDNMASITEFDEVEHFTGPEQKAWFDAQLDERAHVWAELKLIQEINTHPSFNVLHGQEETHETKVETEEEMDGIKIKFITFNTDIVSSATTALFIPQAGVLLTSGLVCRDSLLKAETFNWGPWTDALDVLIELNPAMLVPGHGSPAVGYDLASAALVEMKDDVQMQLDWTTAIREEGLKGLEAACRYVELTTTGKTVYRTGTLGDGKLQHMLPVITAMYNYMGGFGKFFYPMCDKLHGAVEGHAEL